MVADAQDSWQEMSGRERVRAVMETLDGAATIQEIADRADVSRTTADDELERLAADNRVRKRLVEDKKGYELNPVRLYLDEITRLIEEHSRTELEAKLEALVGEREALEDEFGLASLDEFTEELADRPDLSAAEIRERRNVAATWETLESECNLVRHALRLYDDVSSLTDADAAQLPSFS
jgi:predicted ArsR family transcriptional regulator